MLTPCAQQSKNPARAPHQASDPTLVLERRTQHIKPPKKHQVVLLNDDYTPMDFVVHVLESLFNKDTLTATQIMVKIHTEGRAVCALYPRDMAHTKVDQVRQAARSAGHPLQAISEPVE